MMQKPTRSTSRRQVPNHRRLKLEGLEDRRLLAITVNTLVDELDGSMVDGDISLRDAIQLAPSGETINFSVNGEINLALALDHLFINKNLTINGPGANLLTIDAGHGADGVPRTGDGSRVFFITDHDPSSSLNVTISGVTITGGDTKLTVDNRSGGGIHNSERLTLTDSVVSGNFANISGGGIYSWGTLTVTRSTLSGNRASDSGGGIFNRGWATITDSVVSGNGSYRGGGIANSYSLTVTGSTISGNGTTDGGGGIWNLATTTITRSTITDNLAFGYGGQGGGGILNGPFGGITTISSSIVSGNRAEFVPGNEILVSGGVVHANAFNLFGDTGQVALQALYGLAAGPTDILATNDATHPTALADILGPLASNGGPTLTRALITGSPAINAGDPGFSSPPDFDQRGAPFGRMEGSRIDIGAFERQVHVVDILADESDDNYAAGDLSFREAIALSTSYLGPDQILFAAGLNGGTIHLAGELVVSSDVAITGPGANLLTIDADGASRVMKITGGTVDISGLTFTDGNADRGGGLYNDALADTTLTGVAIQGNTATSNVLTTGGGIWNRGTLTVADSTISGNQAPIGGGGGISNNGTLTIRQSTISGNSAFHGGGLLSDYFASMTVSHSTISGNTATNAGGGIRNTLYANTTISHSLITGNNAIVGSEISRTNGTVYLGAFNLIGDSSKTTAQALQSVVAGVSDILATSNGTRPTALAAIISPLADNGGPTKTHLLVTGSPAVDAGDPGASPPSSVDQRGAPFPRIMGRIDIGAVEQMLTVVDTLVDESDGDYSTGDLSLREILGLAGAIPGAETVSFATGLAGGTIPLALGQLVISSSVTVTGPGADQLTINAGGTSRVLAITGGTVHVSGLTLTGGFANRGGGLLNDTPAITTLTDMIIQGNTAYEVSTVAGGGIRNSGTLTITGSTISGNQAANHSGGGIGNNGTLTILQSTLSGNSANLAGGAIYNDSGNATIRHCTISGNTAVEGGGLGSHFGGTTTVDHSIVSGNIGLFPVGSEVFLRSGTVNLNSFNLLGDSSKSTYGALRYITPGPTDILATSNGTMPTALAAILAPLADNGGPTRTHDLVAGSPAINAGNAGFVPPPDVDQRGAPFARVWEGNIDIGAIESVPGAMVVDTLVDESDGNYTTGDFSLREALALTSAHPGGETITFSVTGTIDILSQLPVITDAVTIIGPGADQLAINAHGGGDDQLDGDGFRILEINNGTATAVNVAISGLTLTGADVPHSPPMGSTEGGAILNRENLTIDRVAIVANRARFGGGIHLHPAATVTISNSLIAGNVASQNGGGVHSSGIFFATNVTISGNSAVAGGGIVSAAVTPTPARLELRHSTVTGNTATSVNTAGMWFFTNYGPTWAMFDHSIINNSIVGVGGPTILQGNYNLFSGADPGILGSSNLLNTDPQLGPLTDNGGPTETHALRAGSPAIDAGDAAAVAGSANVPLYDQRGMSFDRVRDGDGNLNPRIDIGAFELQASAVVDGDFNDDGLYDCLDIDQLVAAIAAGTNNLAFDLTGDGLVNLADRDAWLVEGGTNNPAQTGGNPFRLGDANLDGVVDGSDFNIWNSNKFTANAAWCSGDFSADGFVDGSDFSIWNSNKFTSSTSLRRQPGSAVVPRTVVLRPLLAAQVPVVGRAADPQSAGSSSSRERDRSRTEELFDDTFAKW